MAWGGRPFGSCSVFRARPPAASATAAAELGIDELCEELAVAGGRNDDWPAIRGGKLELAAKGFDDVIKPGGPPIPGRLGRLKIDVAPNIGLSLKIPRAISVAFGIPLRSGLYDSIGPEKFGCWSVGLTSSLLKGMPFVTVVIVVFFSEISCRRRRTSRSRFSRRWKKVEFFVGYFRLIKIKCGTKVFNYFTSAF